MRTLTIVAGGILAAGLSTTSVAQDTEPQVWQGESFITGFPTKAAESTCTSQGIASVGDYYLVIYRPIIPGSPENPTSDDEGLTFFGGRNAIHYYTDPGVRFAKRGDAYIVYLSTHADASSQSTSPAAIPYDLKISPAKITLKTKTVTISGSIDDFENVSGCDVTLTAALDLRVD
jgi:hypothetical protein